MITMSISTSTSALNNTVNKLILDRRCCEKLHKKLTFADPVFITSGINSLIFCLHNFVDVKPTLSAYMSTSEVQIYCMRGTD